MGGLHFPSAVRKAKSFQRRVTQESSVRALYDRVEIVFEGEFVTTI